MTLINWISKKLSNTKDSSDNAQISKPSSDITLEYILETHHILKEKLETEMNGHNNPPLNIGNISQDNLCSIGKWLYGEGKDLYGHLPEYESARKVHAELHLCAGEILTEHHLGNMEQAQQLLKTKFRNTSNKNQLEFARLFGAGKKSS